MALWLIISRFLCLSLSNYKGNLEEKHVLIFFIVGILIITAEFLVPSLDFTTIYLCCSMIAQFSFWLRIILLMMMMRMIVMVVIIMLMIMRMSLCSNSFSFLLSFLKHFLLSEQFSFSYPFSLTLCMRRGGTRNGKAGRVVKLELFLIWLS